MPSPKTLFFLLILVFLSIITKGQNLSDYSWDDIGEKKSTAKFIKAVRKDLSSLAIYREYKNENLLSSYFVFDEDFIVAEFSFHLGEFTHGKLNYCPYPGYDYANLTFTNQNSDTTFHLYKRNEENETSQFVYLTNRKDTSMIYESFREEDSLVTNYITFNEDSRKLTGRSVRYEYREGENRIQVDVSDLIRGFSQEKEVRVYRDSLLQSHWWAKFYGDEKQLIFHILYEYDSCGLKVENMLDEEENLHRFRKYFYTDCSLDSSVYKFPNAKDFIAKREIFYQSGQVAEIKLSRIFNYSIKFLYDENGILTEEVIRGEEVIQGIDYSQKPDVRHYTYIPTFGGPKDLVFPPKYLKD